MHSNEIRRLRGQKQNKYPHSFISTSGTVTWVPTAVMGMSSGTRHQPVAAPCTIYSICNEKNGFTY